MGESGEINEIERQSCGTKQESWERQGNGGDRRLGDRDVGQNRRNGGDRRLGGQNLGDTGELGETGKWESQETGRHMRDMVRYA